MKKNLYRLDIVIFFYETLLSGSVRVMVVCSIPTEDNLYIWFGIAFISSKKENYRSFLTLVFLMYIFFAEITLCEYALSSRQNSKHCVTELNVLLFLAGARKLKIFF